MELEKNPKTRSLYKRLLVLSDKVSGLAFPTLKRVKQITVYHCGPAVLESLFSFVGVRASQTGVVRSLRAQKKIRRIGLSVKDLARAAGALGKGKYSFWKKANSTVYDLDAIVNKFKVPVGVEWQGLFYEFADEDNGHYGVITRLDRKSGTLRIMDPFYAFTGIDRKFEIKHFVKRWWDTNDVKVSGTSKLRTVTDRRMMFVITLKNENWPKKLGMAKA